MYMMWIKRNFKFKFQIYVYLFGSMTTILKHSRKVYDNSMVSKYGKWGHVLCSVSEGEDSAQFQH